MNLCLKSFKKLEVDSVFEFLNQLEENPIENSIDNEENNDEKEDNNDNNNENGQNEKEENEENEGGNEDNNQDGENEDINERKENEENLNNEFEINEEEIERNNEEDQENDEEKDNAIKEMIQQKLSKNVKTKKKYGKIPDEYIREEVEIFSSELHIAIEEDKNNLKNKKKPALNKN